MTQLNKKKQIAIMIVCGALSLVSFFAMMGFASNEKPVLAVMSLLVMLLTSSVVAYLKEEVK